MKKPSVAPGPGKTTIGGRRRTPRRFYVMDDEERAAVEEGLEQARRGEFVSDDEMNAFWKRLGVR